MDIRPAEEKDIPAIVELLKVSLGESLMPKSEAFWRWKHVDNPFGRSPVLLAWAGGQLIGVRAFLRWQWKHERYVRLAVRAVDTATHPSYQGQGIFKKLTLALLETCSTEGIEFVFNTPNHQSRPGYLKMGWQDVGPVPVVLTPVIPWGVRSAGHPFSQWATARGLDELAGRLCAPNSLQTAYSPSFLRWRYGEVPVADYLVAESADVVAIYRLKDNRWGRELRVTECWDPARRASSVLQAAARAHDARFISHSYLARKSGWLRVTGPRVTVRPLASANIVSGLIRFQSWHPTLGDLELF